jgi:hypothetical protein
MARIKTPASVRANSFPAIMLAGAAVKVAVGAASAAAAALAANITCVRVCADTNCHIRITQAGTAATTNDTYLPKDRAEYFNVTPGDIITVIRDTADGNLFINPAAVG